MPDHVHLLVAGESPASDARDFLKRSKQLSGYWYSTRHQQRLWQRSAWDRVLRSEDDTLDVIRYLLANPVRAKLVSSPLEYPFSGSLVYTREQLLSAFHATASA